jgi:hypothetical protein
LPDSSTFAICPLLSWRWKSSSNTIPEGRGISARRRNCRSAAANSPRRAAKRDVDIDGCVQRIDAQRPALDLLDLIPATLRAHRASQPSDFLTFGWGAFNQDAYGAAFPPEAKPGMLRPRGMAG